MEETDSVYLYSKDQKNLYGEVLEELEYRTCPSTHTVYALMDADETELPESMVKHVSNCKECQKMAQLTRAFMGSVDQLIPSFERRAPKNLKDNVIAITRSSEFSLSSKSKKNSLKFYEGLKESLFDLLSVLFSIKMFIVYIMALLLGLALNLIFN